MSSNTQIEWTDATWNCLRGCSRVSEGCRNCYAERQAGRWCGPGQPYEGLAQRLKATSYKNGLPIHGTAARWTGEVRFIEEHLYDPLRWRKPKRIFVNSMSDLFHDKVQDNWIDRIFDVMTSTGKHTFQILTKRPERMLDYMRMCVNPEARCDRWHVGPNYPFPPPNVWLGVSVEDQKTADERIPLLLQTPAAIRWVSYEPALAPVDFTRIGSFGGISANIFKLKPGIDWLVVGGESGPGARPFNIQWARDVIAQCKSAGVPCFVKQLGTYPEAGLVNAQLRMMSLGLEDVKGGNPEEWPEDLRVREYPQ